MSEEYAMTPEDWAAEKAGRAAKAARLVELLSCPNTVDLCRRCAIFFCDGARQIENRDPTDYEPTVAIMVEPCGWCSEWCGHVFVVMRAVGHPNGRDFDLVMDPDQAERMGQALIRSAERAREEIENLDGAAEAARHL
jgi:hypothetical protein